MTGGEIDSEPVSRIAYDARVDFGCWAAGEVMRVLRPKNRIAFLGLGLGLGLATAVVGNNGDALAAAHIPALTIDARGCRFSPPINRILLMFRQHSDMRMHTEKRLAGFTFESLHGVGVVEKWDAEWSEVRLYFRENLPALKVALRRTGLRVDGRGHVAATATEDGSYLNVEATPNDGRYFADARSYFACGST